MCLPRVCCLVDKRGKWWWRKLLAICTTSLTQSASININHNFLFIPSSRRQQLVNYCFNYIQSTSCLSALWGNYLVFFYLDAAALNSSTSFQNKKKKEKKISEVKKEGKKFLLFNSETMKWWKRIFLHNNSEKLWSFRRNDFHLPTDTTYRNMNKKNRNKTRKLCTQATLFEGMMLFFPVVLTIFESICSLP